MAGWNRLTKGSSVFYHLVRGTHNYKKISVKGKQTVLMRLGCRLLKVASLSRKMPKSGCPKKLWDHCLPYDAIVHSHTALDIYGLEGQVPETLMSGQAADTNQCNM